MNLKLTPKTGFVFAALLLAVSLTLSLSLAFCERRDEREDEKHRGQEEGAVTTSADYTYQIDISAYANALNTTDEKYLVLANKTCVIGEEYLPIDLTPLDTNYTKGGKEISLAGNAAAAAEALIREMRACGITDVSITSGYRSFAYQKTLYERYFNEEKAAHPDWSDEQIKSEVLTYSAFPGTSEHQTGLCVDLITDEMVGLWNFGSETPDNPYDKGFTETRAFEWLKDNAHKFGFILRYPENKVDLTGYAYESWHYRFVGIDAAAEIYERSVTLEEYLNK